MSGLHLEDLPEGESGAPNRAPLSVYLPLYIECVTKCVRSKPGQDCDPNRSGLLAGIRVDRV